MEIVKPLKDFMSLLYNNLLFLFSTAITYVSLIYGADPPASPSVVDIEIQASPNNNSNSQDKDLGKTILGFSFPAAIALLLFSYQTQSQLSSSFHFLSFAVWLAFSASLVGILLRPKFPSVSNVVEQISIVSAAIAFFLLMQLLLPTSLKWVAWISCVLSFAWFVYGLFVHTRS